MNLKKEQIIVAARDLFGTYGYKRVTMDEIAKKSGVTKKTIYSYFNDKDDLIKYLVLEKISEIKDIVYKIKNSDLSIVNKTHNIIYSLLNFQKDEKLIKMLGIEASDMPLGVAKKWYDFVSDAVLAEIKLFIDDSISNGFIKNYDSELLSFIIYKIYFAFVFEREEVINEKQISEIIDFLSSGLFRGDKDEKE